MHIKVTYWKSAALHFILLYLQQIYICAKVYFVKNCLQFSSNLFSTLKYDTCDLTCNCYCFGNLLYAYLKGQMVEVEADRIQTINKEKNIYSSGMEWNGMEYFKLLKKLTRLLKYLFWMPVPVFDSPHGKELLSTVWFEPSLTEFWSLPMCPVTGSQRRYQQWTAVLKQ